MTTNLKIKQKKNKQYKVNLLKNKLLIFLIKKIKFYL